MKQTLLFDLDDTLIHCNKYFYMIIDQFSDLMTTWFSGYGITADTIRDKQTEIDIAQVHVLGFKSDHFPQSFIDTYRYFSDITGRKMSILEEDLLWRLGLSVYEQEVEPYPNMQATLDQLAEQGHDLHLYTGGEPLIQKRKIERLQLERYFGSRIYVRRHKNNEALESILSEGNFDRDHTWMIGNSIRTDVVPALTAGIHAIHMKSEIEWLYNVIQIDVQPRGAFFTLQHLIEVPDTIHSYVGRYSSN
ncbi:HAD family hydrolase [Paenibacillus abyssi]|uniref:Haloacid dehalogenase n=1 Tax=Paenibacillus abyssi TaxID=1340531 RepID=A0A917CIW6_9BACL|nr:HAD hydrolase-like protein [Paenibacillus abyssi]GGF90082.1 haloacid dehalogenase [Paenibacillus abyssi]